MRYHLITLGCQMNLSDGERIHTVLKEMGLVQSDSENDAQVVGIIACSVRQKAIDKVYNQIARWNKSKNHRNLITFISGCILPDDRERFLKLFDIVFPMSEVNDLPGMITSFGVATPASLKLPVKGIPRNEQIFSLWNIQPDYQSTFEAFVPIQNGCDKFCTFCAVPYTRGREVSRPSVDIINQVRDLIQQGYKSITLLGQNVNSYGLDKKGSELNFAQLLREIGQDALQMDQMCWIYFTSPHPRDMSDEVLEAIAAYPHLANQIHLPLQSGDEKLLAKMNRNHSMEKYRKIVLSIREKLPKATLFTDIIVGFTGEQEDQHQRTIEAMKEFRFNMAYVAQYSPRPGAASYRWEDTVPKEVKKSRLHDLNEILQETASEYNSQTIGKTLLVLVTGSDRLPGFLKGLTEGKINIRFPAKRTDLVGTFVELKVTSSSGLSLQGEMATAKITALVPE